MLQAFYGVDAPGEGQKVETYNRKFPFESNLQSNRQIVVYSFSVKGKGIWNANGGFVSVLLTHLFVRAKGEVFVLLLRFCSFFCQRFLDNPRANSRQILHAGVLWFRMCLLPFWGLAAPGGRKKGEMKFLLLWESMGNLCILAVFEQYLSNACTYPHQILFV